MGALSSRIDISATGRFLGAFIAFAGRRSLFAGALVLAGAFVDGAGILLIIPLLGIVIGGGHGGRLDALLTGLFAFFGITSVLVRLSLLVGFFAILMAVRGLIVVWRDVLMTKLQTGFVEYQRAALIGRLGAARWDQVVRLSHARVTHLLGADILRINMACYVTIQCSVALALLVIQAGLALVLSPALAAIALLLQVIGFVAILPSLRKARKLGQYLTATNQALNNSATQFLGALKLAKSQNLQARFVDQFCATLAQSTTRQVDYMRHQTGARMAANTMMAVAGAGLVLIGFGVLHIPAPVLITLLFIIARMGGPAQQLQTGAQQLAVALPSFEAIEALKVELASEAEPQTAALPPEALDGPIAFEQVSFCHQQREDGSIRGVQDLSLVITPGEFVGISGASGAGKTTFCDLLAGLFPPQAGVIRIGEHPLDGRILAAWRGRLAYVAQDPFLFHETVRWNLSWSLGQTLSDAAMWEALAVVGADELVRNMAQGLDTLVGERGTLVSGGERQRLALASAILRQPKLLVLDEATSAIDIASERAILAHLLALHPKPTIIMVAHRPESLAHCDRVLTIGSGE